MATTPTTLSLRPSDAHRWLVCKASPGYVLQNKHRIVDREEEYTQEGTVAHELAARYLLTGHMPSTVEPDMKTHIKGYAEFIAKAKGKGDVTLLVETQVKVFYYPGKKGFVDVALIHVDKKGLVRRVHIIDLKYGRGVSVHAERNPQLSSYALGLIRDLEDVYQFTKATEVVITIWQPRVQGEAAERTWAISMNELDLFCTEIGATADDIRARPYAQPFVPGDDVCTFCPAYEFCEARTRWLLGEAEEAIDVELAPTLLHAEEQLELAPPELPAPASLTPAQLSRILKFSPLLKKWLEKTEKYVAASMLQHSVEYDGFKVVATNPHRKWRDEAEAEKFLRAHLGLEVAAPRSLITPAKAEELLKAREKGVRATTLEKLQDMVVRPEGQPTIAPVSDNRPAWQDVDVASEFPDASISEDDQSLL